MGKRGRMVVVALAVALLAVMAWAVLRAPALGPDPVYNGKPLSYWLLAFNPAPRTPNRPAAHEAFEALRQIGSNAVPTLLQLVRAHDFPPKVKLLNWAMRHHIPGIHYSDPELFNLEGAAGFGVLVRPFPNGIGI